jgi:hypothetical protein
MSIARTTAVLAAALFLAGASIVEARPGGGGNRGYSGGGGQRHHGHGGHGHRHGHGHGRYYYRPFFYPYSSFYYPPAYYPPAVYVAPAAPTVYVEQQPHYVEPVQPQAVQPAPQPSPQAQPAAPNYWYYCAATQAYYPDVGFCAGGWQRVPAQPQDVAP